MKWWEQEDLDLKGMRTEAQQAEQTEGSTEREGTENAIEDQLSGEDTVVTITLETEPNATLAYAPRLEIHHPIMSKLGEHRGQ